MKIDEIRFIRVENGEEGTVEDIMNEEVDDYGSPRKEFPFIKCFIKFFNCLKSLFKLVWKEILVYYIICLIFALIYTFALDSTQQAQFESVLSYFQRHASNIPIVLMLGFFTSTSLSRWFDTMRDIPGTSQVILIFTQSLQGKKYIQDGREILDRYTRYVLLYWLLTFRVVCPPLRERFPSLLNIEDTGFLLKAERLVLEKYEKLPGGKSTTSLVVYEWLNLFLKDIMTSGKFLNTADYRRNLDAIRTLKKSAGKIVKLASNNILMSLAQLVTLTIYCYGVLSILGHQLAEKDKHIFIINIIFPSPNALSFFFYYVWLMLGRIALNPFEENERNIDLVKKFREYVTSSVRLRKYYDKELSNIFQNEMDCQSFSSEVM